MAQNKRTSSLDGIWTHVVCTLELWVGHSKVGAEPRAKARDRQSQEGVVTGSMWFDYSFEATVTWYQMRALSKEGWK